MYPDRNNFAPRLGFAWDMLGNAKLVMRGGFGIFYDLQDGATNLQFGGEPPFGGVANMYPNSFAGFSGDTMADPFLTYFGDSSANPFPFASRGLVGTLLTPKIPYAYLTDPHFRTPYSYNLNYRFQWQATRDTMVEAVYVGSFGRSLISNVETNFPDPTVMQEQLDQFGFVYPDCARPLAACVGGATPYDPNGTPTGALQLYSNVSNGYSNSNQFQLTVDKRFSRHFALRAAYTVAKTTDITSGYRSRSFEYTDPWIQNSTKDWRISIRRNAWSSAASGSCPSTAAFTAMASSRRSRQAGRPTASPPFRKAIPSRFIRTTIPATRTIISTART